MVPEPTLIAPLHAPVARVVDDAYRQLTPPGLGGLSTRAREAECEYHDDAYLPTLSRECWLARHAGLPISPLPSAPYVRLAGGDTADTCTWACLQPVHIHAARDYLVILGLTQLRLEAADADALRAAVAPLVDEVGITLNIMHVARWCVANSPFGDLIAVILQRATGHNIDIWVHKGEQERAWRKFQNETQMTWHDHPVNQAREARGLLPVNSVWLFSQGALIGTCPTAGHMVGADPFFTGLCHADYATELCTETLAAVPFDDTSIATLLGDVDKPYLSADRYDWIEVLRVYDRDWFSPTADTLADSRIDAVSLVLAGDPHYARYRVTRRELAIGPFGWLRRFSRLRTSRDVLLPLSVTA